MNRHTKQDSKTSLKQDFTQKAVKAVHALMIQVKDVSLSDDHRNQNSRVDKSNIIPSGFYINYECFE